MSQLQLLPPPPPAVSQKWQWPIDSSHYDHSVELSPVELSLLKGWLGPAPDLQKLKLKKKVRAGLTRLIQPVEDIAGCLGANPCTPRWRQTLHTLLLETYQRNKTFWGWTQDQWLEIIGESDDQFNQRYGWKAGSYHGNRRCLVLTAYLLEVIPEANLLFEKVDLGVTLAGQVIFGKDFIEAGVERIVGVLKSWGYQQQDHTALSACLCYLFLQVRSPYLEDISLEQLHQAD